MIRWGCLQLCLNYGAFWPSGTVGVKPVCKLIKETLSRLLLHVIQVAFKSQKCARQHAPWQKPLQTPNNLPSRCAQTAGADWRL